MTGLTLDGYQKQALTADRQPPNSLTFPLLGLFGETGTLLSLVKKKHRDSASYLGYTPHVTEELGDVLWYFASVANRAGIPLSELANNLDQGLSAWRAGAVEDLRFQDLQKALRAPASQPTPAFEKTLLSLAAEVGAVLSQYQLGRANNQAALKGCLVNVLSALVKAAEEAGVTLEAAAEKNLFKIFDRWPKEKSFSYPFDQEAPSHEQLPRRISIDIFERKVGSNTYVFQQCNGIYVGDRLTDNVAEPDDYRFHDVFHYAYCAILTWSPVTRALFRLKRKSNPLVDETEDGARAILIEEGISTWIFNQAKQLKFFEGMNEGELSLDMLKAVRQFVSGYEPEACPLWLWEEAILQGYKAFRFLRANRRARVTIDVPNRRLLVEELL